MHGALSSTPLQVAGNLAVFVAIVFWLGLAFWMYRDARRRVTDPWLVAMSAFLGIAVPYLGALIYLLFRPPETLAEAHARQIEIAALENRLGKPDEHCPVCLSGTDPSFLVCPVCTTRLRTPCVQCESPLDPLWQVCPYCTTPVATAPTLEPVDLDAALTREALKPKTRPAA